jgi:hypothetical protein
MRIFHGAALLIMLAPYAPTFADGEPVPGWDKVFIEVNHYSRTLQKPIKGDSAEVYQQTARYDWSGGRFEQIDITLARNPEFKKKYSAEAMKAEKDPPKETEINNRKAWIWERKSESGKVDEVTHRLVVLLSDDKAIIIEQKGQGAKVVDLAKSFDFDKVEKALAAPPK